MPSIVDNRGYNQGYKTSESVSVRTERRVNYMLCRMVKRKDLRILEIGCGTGRHSFLLAHKTGAYVLATDICAPFIEEASKNFSLPNLEYRQLDFNDASTLEKELGGNKFDYIVGDGILHHLYHNLSNSLAAIYTILKPGGGIVFLEPNFWNPYCLVIFNIPLFRKLARLEPSEMSIRRGFIHEKLAKAGFDNIIIRYRDFLVPGIPAFMIKPVIAVGAVLEKIPVLDMLAQSVFIYAAKQTDPT
jgi:SAM-dependent methyltransferase